MIRPAARLRDFLARDLWRAEAPPRSLARVGLSLLRLAAMVGQGFVRHRLLLRASALSYVAMLSVVPLLAVALGVAEALGVGLRDRVAPLIVSQIAAGAPGAAETILGLLDRVNFASLGTLGAVSLLFTTVLAVGNVERALNDIWGVEQARPFARRFADYLAVIVVTPLLLGVAVVVGTGLESQALVRWLLRLPGMEDLYHLGLRQLPTLFLWAGFSFVYWFMPNTAVRPRSAVLGGFVAAVLFTVAQRAYVGGSLGVARAHAVFGSLAQLPLLLTWLYVSAAITLFGAEVGYAYQHLRLYRREMLSGGEPGPAELEALGLAVAAWVGRRFRDGAPPPDAEELAELLDAPPRAVRHVVTKLVGAGILAFRGAAREGALQLGRPAERVGAGEVLGVLRGGPPPGLAARPAGRVVLRLLEEMDAAREEALRGRSLADLVAALPGEEDR